MGSNDYLPDYDGDYPGDTAHTKEHGWAQAVACPSCGAEQVAGYVTEDKLSGETIWQCEECDGAHDAATVELEERPHE